MIFIHSNKASIYLPSISFRIIYLNKNSFEKNRIMDRIFFFILFSFSLTTVTFHQEFSYKLNIFEPSSFKNITLHPYIKIHVRWQNKLNCWILILFLCQLLVVITNCVTIGDWYSWWAKSCAIFLFGKGQRAVIILWEGPSTEKNGNTINS